MSSVNDQLTERRAEVKFGQSDLLKSSWSKTVVEGLMVGDWDGSK